MSNDLMKAHRRKERWLKLTEQCHFDPFETEGPVADTFNWCNRVIEALEDLAKHNHDAAKELEARIAELETVIARIAANGRITSGGVRRPAKYIQIPADDFVAARALLKGTDNDR